MSIFSRLFGKKSNLTVDSDIKKQDGRGRNIAFVDTEVGLKDHKIHDIGALRHDGATFHQASQTALNKFLQEGKVDYICGLRFFISNDIWNIKNKFNQQYSVVPNE